MSVDMNPILCDHVSSDPVWSQAPEGIPSFAPWFQLTYCLGIWDSGAFRGYGSNSCYFTLVVKLSNLNSSHTEKTLVKSKICGENTRKNMPPQEERNKTFADSFSRRWAEGRDGRHFHSIQRKCNLTVKEPPGLDIKKITIKTRT